MTKSVDPDQLASQKPTDLDLHCLQRWGISEFIRTRVNLLYCHIIYLDKKVFIFSLQDISF